ncbi:MAG: hypothetical protein KGK30_08455, partial [Elusimicrobia bacterium]|nr:hypothetical protein [Elusimicrobiota bacterium]
TRFSKTFHQDGFRVGEGAPLHTFKRVDSIDQYMLDSKGRHGNENADVIATDAKALGLRWKRVVVLKPSGELPLAGPDCVEVRGHDTDPSYARIFRVSGLTPEGGERIDILASGLKRP